MSKTKKEVVMIYGKFDGKFGKLVCAIDEDGQLNGLWFEDQKYFPVIPPDALWFSEDSYESMKRPLETFIKLKEEMSRYEKGTLKTFTVPLKISGTPFRERVWRALLNVPYGSTTTYGSLSKGLNPDGNNASQAIGGAVGHNPISIIVPCHRVVGATGSLTGYAGGIDKKAQLLEHESAYR